MGTHVREIASIQTVADVVDSTCAVVESDPATTTLAPTWSAMRDKADGLAEKGRKLDRDVLCARSRLNVQDSL